jgi:hypothetical protein
VRVGLDQLGQVAIGVRIPTTPADGSIPASISTDDLLLSLRFFVYVVHGVYASTGKRQLELSLEIHDADGLQLATDLQLPSSLGAGTFRAAEVSVREIPEFSYSPDTPVDVPVASLLCELAARFRTEVGGICLDEQRAKARCQELDRTHMDAAIGIAPKLGLTLKVPPWLRS